MNRTIVGLFAATLVACGGAQPAPQAPASNDIEVAHDGQSPEVDDRDAPEISRGVGRAGGVVVLWPRIVLSRGGPSSPDDATRAVALQLQKRLASMIRAELPGVPVDLRPEPERVCPQAGCVGVSVGILMTRAGEKGCSATVLVGPPDVDPVRLVPWAGRVEPKQETIPFREHAEQYVRVRDLARCDELVQAAAGRDGDVIKAIRGALRR